MNITINSLVDMGYEKSKTEIWVKVDNDRNDLALEYLNIGIPDSIKKNNSRINNNTINNNPKNEVMNELKKQTSIKKFSTKIIKVIYVIY